MKATAKLTIYPNPSRAGRYTAIELTGEGSNLRAKHRRIDVDVTATIKDALAAYVQREGLTVVGRPKKIGTSLQVGVR